MAGRIDTPLLRDAPEQTFPFLRKLLPKALHPYARGLRKRLQKSRLTLEEPYASVYEFTQVSPARQRSIHGKATALVADGVEGDFVECGVLDGGTAALLAHAAKGDERRVHLFDAWQGLPEITEEDGEDSRRFVGDVVGSPRRVRAVLDRVGAKAGNIVFHRGWFNETIPKADIPKVAFLHVDCDFYEPTLMVLNAFFPRMASGGWVQIDDYADFEGSRVATNEFLDAHPELEFVVEDKPGGAAFFRVP